MSVKRFCLAGIVGLLLCVGALQAEERPAWTRAWRYRLLVSVPAGGPGAYYIWVFAGSRAGAGGSDFCVLNPQGKAIPFSVVNSTPEGKYLIAFRDLNPDRSAGPRSPSAGGGQYSICFGNPSATAFRQGAPEQGLVLETRPIPEGAPGPPGPWAGDVETWRGAQAALEKAKTIYGAEFWPQVYDAYNPFGSQADYISVYNGYIDCPKDGLYKFSTMSEDASFLLIDNELVAQWPGRNHNIHAGRHGEHSGQQQLRVGRHAFRYVGFSFGGPKRVAAAWMPPGKTWWEIIPASAFIGVAEAKAQFCEDGAQPVCAAFSMRPLRYLESEDLRIRMVAVQFNSLGSASPGLARPPSGGQACDYIWDFGDGQSSGLREPIHVYLLPGSYDVKLTAVSAAQAKGVFSMKVVAGPIWNDLDFTFARRQEFWERTRNYDVAKLQTGQLLAFREFLKALDPPQSQKLFDADVELRKRGAQVTPATLCAVAMELAEYYLDPLNQWPQAEQCLALAMDLLPKEDLERRFDIRLKLADLYLYYARNPDKAGAMFAALKGDPKIDARRKRLTVIRLGDIERDAGRLEEARKLYAQAEADPAFAPKGPLVIAEGRYSQEVEWQIAEGNGEAALAALENWLWFYPAKRFEGKPMVFRLKANLLLKNYREVAKQAGIYLGFSTDPEYAPQVHALEGQAWLGLGRKDEARKHFQAVLDNWPESPASKDARAGLERAR